MPPKQIMYVCRCGKITYTQPERRNHLCSKEHKTFQRNLEQMSLLCIEIKN